MASKDSPPDQLRAVPLHEVRRMRGDARVALPRSKVASLRAFRRIRSDRIVGTLGLLLMLVGLLLVWTWEKPPVVEKKFGVEWPSTVTVLEADNKSLACNAAPQSGGLCQGAQQQYTPAVDTVNVTAVTFWLTWTDDVAGQGSDQSEGDLFELEVKGPEGTNVSFKEQRVGGRGGMNMSYSLPMSGIPDIASVPAETEEEARSVVGDRTNETGRGTWTFTVRLLRAGSHYNNPELRSTPCAPNSPHCQFDAGNAYSFHFEYATYRVGFKKLF